MANRAARQRSALSYYTNLHNLIVYYYRRVRVKKNLSLYGQKMWKLQGCPLWSVQAGTRRGEPAPTVVLQEFVVPLRPQLLDRFADILGMLSGAHQKRVICFDNDEILNAHRHHELARRDDHIAS